MQYRQLDGIHIHETADNGTQYMHCLVEQLDFHHPGPINDNAGLLHNVVG